MNLLFGLYWFWRSFLLFWWGCTSFHFPVYNINSTSSPTITYSNILLFTNASFHFLIYNINSTSSPKLTYSNIFIFTTACFYPMWLVRIWIRIGGVTCCLTFRVLLFLKQDFFGEGLDLPSFLFFMEFSSPSSFSISAALCLLVWYFIIVYIKRHISRKYDSSSILNVCCIKSKNIWLRFITSSFWTSMSYFSWLIAILYC